MTKEEREMMQVDKRIKKETASEILCVIPRLVQARYGEEYPKKVEVKILCINRRQTFNDMVHFNDEGWNEIGYVYNARDRDRAFTIINEYKAKLRQSPAVKKVI